MRADVQYPDVLTRGGDDRCTIGSKGVNKYHCKPEPIAGALFRGSCTCNLPTDRAYAAAQSAFEKLQAEEVTVSDIMEGVRSQIKHIFQLPAGTEVFTCPSGSDAEYIPLLIAKTLGKGRKIVNIVTCTAEVGSGTLDAAGGRFFSKVVPMPDDGDDAKDSPISPGVPLEGLGEGVETVSLPARSKAAGDILDPAHPVQEIVDRCAQEDAVPIVHCVLGSKTGIYEPFPTTNFGRLVATRDAFIVVDACQGRFKSGEIQEFLARGAMVLLSGSKFFRGPPFSGAVLVPGSIAERLALTEVAVPRGLRKFLTAHDVPPALQAWRAALKAEENQGLALRWVAALAEMEPTMAIPEAVRESAIQAWQGQLVAAVRRFRGHMEVLPAQPHEAASIVSFRLLHPAKPGAFLDLAQSKTVFEAMTRDLSPALGAAAAPRCYIGQPVSISDTASVLRIALGADSLRRMVEDPEGVLAEEEVMLRKMALLVDKVEALPELLKA